MRTGSLLLCALLLACSTSKGFGENCLTSADLDESTRNSLTTAALRDFSLVAKGDATSLRQGAVASLAANFSGIEARIKEKQSALAGAKANVRPPFLLEAEGTAAIPRAEFFCGVFGSEGQTRDSAVFTLSNLPPGKYGVVILDAPSSKGPFTVSLVLQQQSSDWKLWDLYIKPAESTGHDSDWFAARAREFQAKGQRHNAWLYYIEAISLAAPLPIMSTAATDQLYDESQKVQPADFPADGKTTDLSVGTAAGAATYKLTALFPESVGNALDLIVKYQAADISDTQQTYRNNVAVMKALVAKYPELREAFAGFVVRAVDPSGHDYGTLLAMKEIK
ncbi:MAG TPA: hypothetical protein VN310_11695 [Candidatus Dormibacteraeota bacterium]|nr:hypothetical protein [Candidatus Dormibacteraeota bacterium]